MPLSPPDEPLRFSDHLGELRRMMIRLAAACGLGVVAAFLKSDWLFSALLRPFHQVLAKYPEFEAKVQGLQTLAPVEAFMINMKLATVAGLVLASPYALREIWVFAKPALKPSERQALLIVFSLGLFFFLGGVLFGYLVVIPLALQFLMNYNLSFHFIPQWTLEGYFNFVMNFLLVFGLVFELPLVLAALVSIGVATPAFLAHKRKHAILGIFIASAFLAPSADPVTQTIVALPLVALYEVGIWLSYLAVRRQNPPPVPPPGRRRKGLR
ncbi:MAG TPA: twin-arginine translocase subunit TatC [bacterium]|nr:twin-arginine translocase subunit TatC [bacterium]